MSHNCSVAFYNLTSMTEYNVKYVEAYKIYIRCSGLCMAHF